MNHIIIHDRAGLTQFTLRFMPCWSGNRTIHGIRPYVDGLSVSLVYFFDAGRLWLTIATLRSWP